MDLQATRNLVNRKLTEFNVAQVRCREEGIALASSEQKLSDIREALVIAQQVAQEVQEQAHQKIASIVSQALGAIFDAPYEFRILFEQKRGRTEASLVFTREGLDVNPMDGSGGGVVDVAAFALRLSTLMLANPPVRRLLVMDEPMKFLSADYRPKMRVLIEKLAKELGVQMVFVTHSEELTCGKVIRL